MYDVYVKQSHFGFCGDGKWVGTYDLNNKSSTNEKSLASLGLVDHKSSKHCCQQKPYNGFRILINKIVKNNKKLLFYLFLKHYNVI